MDPSPIEFRLDIPKPPSVNRYQARLGNKSPPVVVWRAAADGYLRAAGRYPRFSGAYELEVMFAMSEFGKFDPDNRIKPLSDWLQAREIITNDRLAKRITIHWSSTIVEGCRVIVRPASWLEEKHVH